MATKFLTRDYAIQSFKNFKTVVLDPLFNKKLDNTADVENAGKAVVVDDEGNLVFEDIKTEISLETGNKIESKTDGIFVGSDDAKVDVAQGEDNKGLALIIGEDGNVTLGEAGVQVSEEEGNKIEKLDDGIYVADSSDAWTGTRADFEALDKSTLKDGQEVIITDDDDATGVIDDSSIRGDATWSSQKMNDELEGLVSAEFTKMFTYKDGILDITL